MLCFTTDTVTQRVITDCVINFQSFNQGQLKWYTANPQQ